MSSDRFTFQEWLGTAEEIEAVKMWARNFPIEDAVIDDAEFTADVIASDFERDGWHESAVALLRSELIDRLRSKAGKENTR